MTYVNLCIINESLEEDIKYCKSEYYRLKNIVNIKLTEEDYKLTTCNEIIREFDCLIERYRFNIMIDNLFN
jgi:hypothetical protein